jgi:hypothetical protein
MESSVPGTALKTPGECIINEKGLSLSQKGQSFMWPPSRRVDIGLVLVLSQFIF